MVEVIEDEKEVAVEEDGVQIQEIIEEPPPDQGNIVANINAFTLAKTKEDIKENIIKDLSN